jgi:hypothetical protein
MCVVILKKRKHNGYNTAIILVSEFKPFRHYKGEYFSLAYATGLLVKQFVQFTKGIHSLVQELNLYSFRTKKAH